MHLSGHPESARSGQVVCFFHITHNLRLIINAWPGNRLTGLLDPPILRNHEYPVELKIYSDTKEFDELLFYFFDLRFFKSVYQEAKNAALCS
jgi:hypothetical protein